MATGLPTSAPTIPTMKHVGPAPISVSRARVNQFRSRPDRLRQGIRPERLWETGGSHFHSGAFPVVDRVLAPLGAWMGGGGAVQRVEVGGAVGADLPHPKEAGLPCPGLHLVISRQRKNLSRQWISGEKLGPG